MGGNLIFHSTSRRCPFWVEMKQTLRKNWSDRRGRREGERAGAREGGKRKKRGGGEKFGKAHRSQGERRKPSNQSQTAG